MIEGTEVTLSQNEFLITGQQKSHQKHQEEKNTI
jgi:hypothetical protein